MALTYRQSGLLVHPTSFPGRFGIGDLGPAAYQWLDFLVRAKQQVWQILPLGPTGYGDSPYQCFSAFAGNPYLISPELLLQDGLLTEAELSGPHLSTDYVDYGPVIEWKLALLNHIYRRFADGAAQHLRPEFDAFVTANASWLEDFALFMALKDENGGRIWNEWDPALALREKKALTAARKRLTAEIDNHRFRQFLFFRQWNNVRAYANQHGIQIVGDIPFYVAIDSADVWQNPGLFHLDDTGKPTLVAGVPPDYFSATGQLWGNPLYRWEIHKMQQFSWWVERIRATLTMIDIVRIDHFRAFWDYWEIPASAPTAETGEWRLGPQDEFFHVMRAALGDNLPIIAEDLGEINPEVFGLRDRFNLPGMKILQFAWAGDATDKFLPHNYNQNCVVYTGTHDNDTTRGWYASAPEHERDHLRRYLRTDGSDIAWDLIRLAWSSTANLAVVPFQDILNLGPEARMNTPGKASGNWQWRYRPESLSDWAADHLREITDLYGRAPGLTTSPA